MWGVLILPESLICQLFPADRFISEWRHHILTRDAINWYICIRILNIRLHILWWDDFETKVKCVVIISQRTRGILYFRKSVVIIAHRTHGILYRKERVVIISQTRGILNLREEGLLKSQRTRGFWNLREHVVFYYFISKRTRGIFNIQYKRTSGILYLRDHVVF